MTKTYNVEVNPIFVLGLARNGTTWLVNSLAKNDNIVTPTHWLHYGAHETNFAKMQKMWGSFKTADEYVRFLGKWSIDDVFILAQGDISEMLSYCRDDFYESFFDVMDSFARKNGSKYWTVKMDPQLFWDNGLNEFWNRINQRYSDPKLVAIRRDDDEAIASYLNMEGSYHRMRTGRGRFIAFFLGYSRQKYGNRVIDSFLKNKNHFFVQYENMRNSLSDVESRLDEYLELKGSLGTEAPDLYRKNTSFWSQAPTNTDGPWQAIAKYLANSSLFSKLIIKLWSFVKPEAFPAYHRIIKYQYMRDELVNELRARDAVGLLEKLDSDFENRQ